MKTFKKVIEEKLLKISFDDSPSSPREWSNLGYFITCERKYNSPDQNDQLKSVIETTGEIANNLENHIELIKKQWQESSDDKIIAIYPITRYEHSCISYSLGSKSGFDYSNCGFYVVLESTAKEIGAEAKDFEKIITQELEVYNKYVNGEIYSFILFDESGEIVESMGEIYDLEEIRDYLPEDWKSEELEQYLIN